MEETVNPLKYALQPINVLLDDQDVTDISIYDYKTVFAKYKGKGFILTECAWETNQDIETVAIQIARFVGGNLNEEEPILDARLPDKSRVNIIISPVYRRGVFISIRKFPEESYDLTDLVKFGTLDNIGAEILEILIKLNKNIMISGGTGTGKTTLLNGLCKFIDDDSIIVTVEDSLEISLKNKPMWAQLEAKDATYEDGKDITLRQLIRTALRMSPEWIIPGEVRGVEVIDMLRAFNTGHSGISTVHANTAIDALYALEIMYLMAFDSPIQAIKQTITRSINIVIQIERKKDQRRVIKQICEILPLENEDYKINELYRFNLKGFDKNKKTLGNFGIVEKPKFLNELEEYNIEIPKFWR